VQASRSLLADRTPGQAAADEHVKPGKSPNEPISRPNVPTCKRMRSSRTAGDWPSYWVDKLSGVKIMEARAVWLN